MYISASVLYFYPLTGQRWTTKGPLLEAGGEGGLSGLFLFSLNSKLGLFAPFDLKFSSLDLMQHELLKKNIIKR